MILFLDVTVCGRFYCFFFTKKNFRDGVNSRADRRFSKSDTAQVFLAEILSFLTIYNARRLRLLLIEKLIMGIVHFLSMAYNRR